MASDLIKTKVLQSYTPGVPGSPGSPGVPEQPARTVVQTVRKTVSVSASAMTRLSFNNWYTPLQQLNAQTGRQWSAAQAHYSETWQTVYVNGQPERVPLSWTGAWVEMDVTETVHYPAQPAIPAVPPTAETPPRYVYDLQQGWNAGAHSSKVLTPSWAGRASFEVTNANIGVVIGFSKVSRVPVGVRSGYSDIEYGLIMGDGRARVRHDGVEKEIGALGTQNRFRVEVSHKHLRWYRDDVLIHSARYAPKENYVLAVALYSAGDAILSPSFGEELTIEDGAISVSLEPFNIKAGVVTDLQFALHLQPMNIFAGDYPVAQARLKLGPLGMAKAPLVRGVARMGAVRVRSSDQAQDGIGMPMVPAVRMTSELIPIYWEPTYSVCNLAITPPTITGSALVGEAQQYNMQLAGFKTVASEYAYSVANMGLAPLQSSAVVDLITNLVQATNFLNSNTPTSASGHIFLILSERLTSAGQSSIEMAAVVMDARENVSLDDFTMAGGKILAAALEQLGLASSDKAMVFQIKEGGAVLLDVGSAWAVNTDGNASTRYENYSFNSFMAVRGKHFGVRFDGVYALEGEGDAGHSIEWMVDMGLQDFGTQALKGLNAIYAGVSVQGTLMLRIDDGKGRYTYFARRVDAQQQVQRFDPGRGLRANYFRFELVGEGSMELDGIEFGLVASNRRI